MKKLSKCVRCGISPRLTFITEGEYNPLVCYACNCKRSPAFPLYGPTGIRRITGSQELLEMNERAKRAAAAWEEGRRS